MVTPPGKLEQLAVQLKELSEKLALEEASQVAAPRAKRVRKTIGEVYQKLRKVMEDLDPVVLCSIHRTRVSPVALSESQ